MSDPIREAAVKALRRGISEAHSAHVRQPFPPLLIPPVPAEILLDRIAADPARRRAVVAALLTEDEMARALPSAINFRFLPPRHVNDPVWREVAADILAALRSPDSAEAPEGRS